MLSTLVFFDVETASPTGPPHLVEVGAIRVVEGEVEERFQRLVAPWIPVTPEATACHGLDDAALQSAPDAGDVLAEFFEFVGDDALVAHDVRHDAAAVGFELARRGRATPSNRLFDTLRLSKRLLPDSPDHKLGTLVQHLELELEDLHRALPDAVASWQVFEACRDRMEGEGDGRLQELAGVPFHLGTAGPNPPKRRRNVVRRLETAQRDRTPVRLTYGEEGVPARFEVLPLVSFRMADRDYLEGECLSSGTLKTYRLDRIQRVEPA